jgi:hypothetical protein
VLLLGCRRARVLRSAVGFLVVWCYLLRYCKAGILRNTVRFLVVWYYLLRYCEAGILRNTVGFLVVWCYCWDTVGLEYCVILLDSCMLEY